MTTIRRYEPPSSAQLLRHVLERPELVAAVRELPGDVLGSLIQRIGLEDAGEIIALASAEQLAEVFDHDLWRAEGPGGDEDFDLGRFGTWLEVLSEAGDEFLAQRLASLPEDMLLMVLHRTLLVLDLDALAVKLAEMGGEEAEWAEKAIVGASHYEEWEEFRLIVRVPDHWDLLWNGLLALDRDHHALLRDLIERCCALDTEFINGNGGLYEVLTSEELLEEDVRGDREDRRAAKGYVSPRDARAFLALAKREQQESERDAITRAYFRGLSPAREQAPAPRAAASRAAQELAKLVADAQPVAAAQATAAVPGLPGERRSSSRALARRESAEDAALGRAQSVFEQALAELQEHEPLTAAQRFEELAFLANVWMAGGAHEGRRPRPLEALEFVVSVCDRGLTRVREASPREYPAKLLASTSADLLFRRGYKDHLQANPNAR